MKEIKILIVSPRLDQVFLLSTSPVETNTIVLRAVVTQNGADITGNINVNWQLRLSWKATDNTYQTKIEVSGNPAEAKSQTGGILRIRAAVIIDGREYSARIKVKITGTNPTKEQINNALDNDLLKAMAWIESTWRQFDSNGLPLPPKVKVGQKIPSMRGLFMISEHWWHKDKRIAHNNHNQVAWQWDYNIAAAKEIVDLLHKKILDEYPTENDKRQWDRTLKAYNAGAKSIFTREIPDDFKYVIKIREALAKREWEK